MKDVVCRTYSQAREDVFNIRIKDLPEYSVLYKMLYKSEQIYNDFTNLKTQMRSNESEDMDRNRLLQAVKFQVEFYFGQANY